MFKKENLVTTLFVAVIALLGGLAIASSFVNKDEAPLVLQTTTDMPFVLEEQPLLGEADAPVTLTVFYDYNCPHCQAWDEKVLPILEDAAVGSGTTNIRFVNFQFMRPTSTYAGMAAELVHDKAPESFVAFHKELFANQMTLTLETISERAAAHVPSMTAEEIQQVLEDQSYIDQVLSDKAYGEKMGVGSTPTLFVGEEQVENPGDLAEIQEKINALLASSPALNPEVQEGDADEAAQAE